MKWLAYSAPCVVVAVIAAVMMWPDSPQEVQGPESSEGGNLNAGIEPAEVGLTPVRTALDQTSESGSDSEVSSDGSVLELPGFLSAFAAELEDSITQLGPGSEIPVGFDELADQATLRWLDKHLPAEAEYYRQYGSGMEGHAQVVALYRNMNMVSGFSPGSYAMDRSKLQTAKQNVVLQPVEWKIFEQRGMDRPIPDPVLVELKTLQWKYLQDFVRISAELRIHRSALANASLELTGERELFFDYESEFLPSAMVEALDRKSALIESYERDLQAKLKELGYE